MISIVCVFNDTKVLEEYLLKSLKSQTADYELILIDNTNNNYRSASEALNYGAKKAKGNYLMFVHQDVDLISRSWLNDAEEILNSLENIGIAGVAGRSNLGTITNIEDGIPPRPVSNSQITIPVKVQTLDECLMIIPKNIFNFLSFDEIICDNWHLYGVDFCLTVQKLGYDVYVLPLFNYHRSHADSLSEDYYETLHKLLKKHEDQKLIFTTVKDWITFLPLNIQRRSPHIKGLIISVLRKI